MDQTSLYIEIKNQIGIADNKLGIRIASQGILATAIISIIIGCITILEADNLYLLLLLLAFPNFIQIFIASRGLFPIYNSLNYKKRKTSHHTLVNHLYFGYISSFANFIDYDKVARKYFKNEYDSELSKQIYENSKILSRKYYIFESSSILKVTKNMLNRIICN